MEEDKDIRYFRFSSKIVGGFLCKINISDNINIKLITETCVRYLTEVLLKYNFIELLKKVIDINFHIHSSLEEIIKGDSGKLFYICECKL
jgi:hypothetical protein